MLRVLCVAVLAAGALLAGGCDSGAGRPVAVPRPEAMPRMRVYGATYHRVGMGGRLTALVNDSALVRRPRELWTDLAYPAYGATVNCTFMPVTRATLASALANRMERLTLNAGEAAGELLRLSLPGGGGALVWVMRGACVTPVQFLATDSVGYVLSGSAVMPSAGADAERVRPAVDALAADVVELVKSLRCE